MDELIKKVAKAIADHVEGVISADRIEGEDAIGVELEDGREFFLDFSEA